MDDSFETMKAQAGPRQFREPQCVLQCWLLSLSFMQQSVLLSALRGPDGLRKDHVSKLLIRWLRRCTLLSAFDGAVLVRPYDWGAPQGGSFTGPSLEWKISYEGTRPGPIEWPSWQDDMHVLLKEYLRHVDETPHHFQLHFMHAAEILGYKHPDSEVRKWWLECYHELVNDMHLFPESEEAMDQRLGDNERDWRARESVVARGPGAAAPS